MRRIITAIASVCWVGSTALADPPDPPAHPPTTDLPSPAGDDLQPVPPAPAQVAPPVVTPPVVTISTMPVTRTIDGYWDDRPHTDAWIASGVTAGFVATTLGWWLYESRITYRKRPNAAACVPEYVGGHDIHTCSAAIEGFDEIAIGRQQTWNKVLWSLGAATGASAFITACIWARHHHAARHVIEVAPTTGGAQVSLTSAF
jgi:hypothetical protein